MKAMHNSRIEIMICIKNCLGIRKIRTQGNNKRKENLVEE
jgi:hypothetical protein